MYTSKDRNNGWENDSEQGGVEYSSSFQDSLASWFAFPSPGQNSSPFWLTSEVGGGTSAS